MLREENMRLKDKLAAMFRAVPAPSRHFPPAVMIAEKGRLH